MNKSFTVQVIFNDGTKGVRHVLHDEVKESVLL